MRKFRPVSILVYGQSGIGKTVFAASALEVPELNPTLFLNYESGTLSIASKLNEITIPDLGKKNIPGKIDCIKIRKWEDLDKITEYIYSDKNIYKSLIVDSISEINYLCEGAVVSKIRSSRYADGVPTLNDYGVSATYMRKALRSFRNMIEDVKIPVIICAAEQREKDENTGIVTRMPNLTGKLAGESQHLLDVVGHYIKNRKDVREMVFEPENNAHAKDRTEGGKLGKLIENPTLEKIIELLKED